MAFPQANTGGSLNGQRPPAPVLDHFIGADGNAYAVTGDSTTGRLAVNAPDVLAKLPTVGTSGVPSANTLSVQGPPNQFVTSNLTAIDQTITLNCEGMGTAVFFCRQAMVGTIQFRLDYGSGIWGGTEFLIHIQTNASPLPNFSAVTPAVQQWYMVNTKGAKRVQLTVTTYTSGTAIFDSVVTPITYWSNVEIAGGVLPTVTNVTSIASYASGAFHGGYNDTVTVLAANATFTGSARSVGASASLFFYVDFYAATQGSAALGCAIEKSIDSFTTAIPAVPAQTLTAGTPVNMRAAITTSSIRLKYTNGAVLQVDPFSITSATKTF